MPFSHHPVDVYPFWIPSNGVAVVEPVMDQSCLVKLTVLDTGIVCALFGRETVADFQARFAKAFAFDFDLAANSNESQTVEREGGVGVLTLSSPNPGILIRGIIGITPL